MSTDSNRTNTPIACSVSDYDRYTAHFVQAYDGLMTRRVIQAASFRKGPRWFLDLGTGTGQLLLRLAHLPELAHLKLIGLDYFEDVGRRAKKNVEHDGLGGRVHILLGDVHEIPLANNTIDIVISRSTIHHWTNPVRAFRDIYRVLAPGGIALIHDVRRDAPVSAIEVFNASRRLAGIPDSIFQDKYTVREIRAFVEDAGLHNACSVRTAVEGPASIGMELRIAKKTPLD
jgi:ubiquinone/menaquinone biosynthesis C-methylase UbiE